MAFLEDPRMRQRWNRLSHNAGEVTENAAAGIWSFQHHYINPCLASLAASFESCTAPCLGDHEERARRQRERARAHGRAEYSFDFYDDWYAEDELGDAGILGGGWGGEDWDRLLAGRGAHQRRQQHGDDTGANSAVQADQPKRRRGMSYGTRGGRRKAGTEQDPTIIPSTQPIGFLGRLPWKLGKTLRYKPSAADLQDHPRQHEALGMRGETEPLLLQDEDEFYSEGELSKVTANRKRSGTTGSGDTSDSFRSRGDLFPSDGEGEEDAVPLDDEFTMVLDKMGGDDRSSGKTRRSSKGKRPAGRMSRTVSRATMDSQMSRRSSTLGLRHSSAGSVPPTPEVESMPSMEDLQLEEDRIRQEEDAEVKRKRRAATVLAIEKGLRDQVAAAAAAAEANEAGYASAEAAPITPVTPVTPSEDSDMLTLRTSRPEEIRPASPGVASTPSPDTPDDDDFVPARLPNFR